ALIPAATSSSSPARRATSTVFAPSEANTSAIPRPIPLLAPVTIATRPCNCLPISFTPTAPLNRFVAPTRPTVDTIQLNASARLRTCSRYADNNFAKMRSRGHVPVGPLRLIEGEYLIDYRLNAARRYRTAHRLEHLHRARNAGNPCFGLRDFVPFAAANGREG